jgi:hypothetical protein
MYRKHAPNTAAPGSAGSNTNTHRFKNKAGGNFPSATRERKQKNVIFDMDVNKSYIRSSKLGLKQM